ncbi:hypothetical protein GIB67_024738 [Kingdonia uniflora]|uniref:CCHC-type domain-containing protein n=1 Tax=Kingdonia uniflora TaxID=39325 RepID=A0A7J7N9W5_9MAGN|nr:hypothetical protein GIB67_024738 [Kingdonia uniflora]
MMKKLQEATTLQPVFCLAEIVQLDKQASELHAQYRPPVPAATPAAPTIPTVTTPRTFVLGNCYGCGKPGHQKHDCLAFAKNVGLVVDGMRESVIATVQHVLQDEDEEETGMHTTFSWASYDPPKTTVKRILLQEEREKGSAIKSPSLTSKGVFSSHSVPHAREHTNPSVYEYSSVNKVQPSKFQKNQGKPSKQAPISPSFINLSDESSRSPQPVGLRSPMVQVAQRSSIQDIVSPVIANPSSPGPNQSRISETFGFVSNKLSIGVTQAEKRGSASDQSHPISETKINVLAESSQTQRPSITTSVPAQALGLSGKSPSLFEKSDSFKDQPRLISNIRFNFPSDTSQTQLSSTSVPSEMLLLPETSNQVAATSLSPRISELPSELPTSPQPSINSDQTGPLASSSSDLSSSTVPSVSSSPLSFQIPKEQVMPSIPSISPPVPQFSSKSDVNSTSEAPYSHPKIHISEIGVKLENSVTPEPAIKASLNSLPEPPTILTQEDDMEEEAPDTTTELSLGNVGAFGLGSTLTQSTPKTNPFGNLFPNAPGNTATSPFNLTVPSGQMFRPASFSLQSAQTSQPTNTGIFSSGFGAVAKPEGNGFGQPSQLGPGQQALGSVLGGFGQSRQLGAGIPATGFTFPTPSSGGFATAAPGGGGFAAAASGSGGFAGVASGGGGFSGAPFGGGGFAAAAPGGGFGAFGNKQGGGGFSSFGGGSAGSGNTTSPSFTQIRK